MSNHSSDFDETMGAKLFREQLKKKVTTEDLAEEFRRLHLGATKRFPDGKLTPQDDGELAFAVGHTDGKVVIDFGTPTSWIGMPPQTAVDLAKLLIAHAREVSDAKLVFEFGD